MDDRHRDVVELAKRRGFFFPANEPYGGVSGFWTFGPRGAALKRNLESNWRDRFAIGEGHMEIDSPTIIPEPVFEASGHLRDFTDMIVECPQCDDTHRADHLVEATDEVEDAEGLSPAAIEALIEDLDVRCPTCGTSLADVPVETFNLMFETEIGPGSGEPGYLRPETAQGIFVDFNRLVEYARNQLPFGVTQIGRGYRNEISPRRSIIRVRELTLAELELFVDPERDAPQLDPVADEVVTLYPVDAQEGDGDPVEIDIRTAVEEGIVSNPWIAYFIGVSSRWLRGIGVDPDRLRFRQHLPGERAHYARDCWDPEAYLGGDWIEIAGLADRGSYDLRKHA
ncbi:MAG: glycine--tRNA ligase, partial [Halobacteriota archaeon]